MLIKGRGDGDWKRMRENFINRSRCFNKPTLKKITKEIQFDWLEEREKIFNIQKKQSDERRELIDDKKN